MDELRVQEELELAIKEEAEANAQLFQAFIQSEEAEPVWMNGEIQESKPPTATIAWRRPWEILRCNVGSLAWLSQRGLVADLDQQVGRKRSVRSLLEWEPEDAGSQRRGGIRRRSECASDQNKEEKDFRSRLKELEHLVAATLEAEQTKSLKGRMERLMSGRSAYGSKKDPYAEDKKAKRIEKQVEATNTQNCAKFKLSHANNLHKFKLAKEDEENGSHLPSALRGQIKGASNETAFPSFGAGATFSEFGGMHFRVSAKLACQPQKLHERSQSGNLSKQQQRLKLRPKYSAPRPPGRACPTQPPSLGIGVSRTAGQGRQSARISGSSAPPPPAV
jgi:hypothetical protein